MEWIALQRIKDLQSGIERSGKMISDVRYMLENSDNSKEEATKKLEEIQDFLFWLQGR